MNRKYGISITLVCVLVFCTIIISSLEASRIRRPFCDTWDLASVVLVGKVSRLGPPKISATTRRIAIYSIDSKECFKGAEYFKKTLLVVDFHFMSTASLFLLENKTCLLFLKEKSVTEYGIGEMQTYECLNEFPWNPETEKELREAIHDIQAYRKVASRQEKVEFLLSKIRKPNRYLSRTVEKEIAILKVKESIPHFEKLLSTESERTKLNAVSMLRIIGYQPLGKILLTWLKDPEFQDKATVIRELATLKERSAIPEIRKFTKNDNEILRAVAAIALLKFDEPDGKKLLFELLTNGTDRTARYNAIHTLHWNYNGTFSKEEKIILKQLLVDKDEAIRRVAGFILNKIE